MLDDTCVGPCRRMRLQHQILPGTAAAHFAALRATRKHDATTETISRGNDTTWAPYFSGPLGAEVNMFFGRYTGQLTVRNMHFVNERVLLGTTMHAFFVAQTLSLQFQFQILFLMAL